MPTVAEQLRERRETMKLDVQQVAEATKLKSDQIRALEEGDYNYFTAPVYLRGSIRTYATLLKLDVTQLLAQLDVELGGKRFADDLPAAAGKRSGVDLLMLLLSRNWGILAAVIAIALLALGGTAAYRLWHARKTTDPLKGLGPGMYETTEPTGETLPIPVSTNRPR